MRRKREEPMLVSGLYHSDRPKIPREWLLPERLHAAFGADGLKQPCPVAEDDLRRWLAFLGERSRTTIRENWRRAVREVHHPSPLDLFERLREAYGVDEFCAAGAVYGWGRAWHRYDAEVKVDLARRPGPEREAIKSFKPDAVQRDLVRYKEEGRFTLPTERKRAAKKALKGLAELPRILHENPGEDGYLMSCASGLRAQQSSLRFLRGWVKAYGDDSSADFRRINRGGSNIRGRREMVEGGDRPKIDGALLRLMLVAVSLAIRPRVGVGERLTVERVPWIERPEFVEEEAWLVPLCLWTDTALAKFGGLGMKDAGRAAADRIRALELERPGFYVVGLSKAGRVVRLPKPVKRKAAFKGRV